MGADCKSAGLRLQWFKSTIYHNFLYEKRIKMNDKEIEKKRYDERAKRTDQVVASNLPKWLLSPAMKYESVIAKEISASCHVVELGSGVGANTETVLKTGAKVIATDISDVSLESLRKKYISYSNLKIEVSDMEKLPFHDRSFDFVVSAGSLSYGDNDLVMNEIYRVLKPSGTFICMDSLNDNPIYRFNRFIHFRRGHRTKSTLIRMPDSRMIEKYRELFHEVNLYFYGSISWVMPLLNKILDDEKCKKISDDFDRLIRTKRSAFKFVMVARKSEISK